MSIRSPYPFRPKNQKPPDIAGGISDLLQIKKVLADLESFKIQAQKEHEQKRAEMDGHIANAQEQLKRAQKIQKGEPGKPGAAGESIKGAKGDAPPVHDVAALIKNDVVEALKPHIPPAPPGEPGKDAEPLDPMAVIELIKEKKLLLPEHIHGLDIEIKRGVVRGGGDTVAAGTGVTIIQTNGVKTINSTGGGGFTELAATETPNGVIKVFTFAVATAQPSYIVADNVWLKATSKAGTVNWTWASGTKKATLTIPPADDIYAIV